MPNFTHFVPLLLACGDGYLPKFLSPRPIGDKHHARGGVEEH